MEAMGFRINGLNKPINKNNVVIPPVDFQHVLCKGATGTGKTASLILPTLADRLKKGHTVIFFDHKGHEHKKVKALAKEVGRLDDVVEIGKPHTSYINLLAELDVIRLKEMIKEKGMSKDPYWSNSAANLIEDVMGPLRKLYDIVQLLKKDNAFAKKGTSFLNDLKDFGIDIEKEPSFQTLSFIIANPHRLLKYKEIVVKIPDTIANMLKSKKLTYEGYELIFRRQLLGKILSLKKTIKATDRFTLSEDKSDTNTGNNAVLQTLDNTIASYAKKDYINIGEYTMSGLMENNAIIIIDTQSFGEDIMKLFLESLLKKAVMRLRVGTESAMSVFIDEANRVLFPSIDLHSDVLREAKVELVIAIQNEDQMVAKFTETVWHSIRGNIKHQYIIDMQHQLFYNDNVGVKTEPLLLSDNQLYHADRSYYGLEKNRMNIEKNFLGDNLTLPKVFTVAYDLDMFDHESSIIITNSVDESFIYCYHGEEIVTEVLNTYPDIGQEYDLVGFPVKDECIENEIHADQIIFNIEELLTTENEDDIPDIDINDIEF
jgi:hypothetical protein